jgi:hypothetical protein
VNISEMVSELTRERGRLEKAIGALSHLEDRGTGRRKKHGKVVSISQGRRRLSAAARRRISEAQKRRESKRGAA